MILKLSLLVLTCDFFTRTQTAKILGVFPTPSISHQVVFRKITQELVNKGHEVTVITTDPAYPKGKSPSNLKEIDVHDVSYEIWRKLVLQNNIISKFEQPDFWDARQGFLIFINILISQLQTPEVQELISSKNNSFDLILIEAVMRPALVFSHIFKAPVILVSSFGAILNNYDIIGAPSHPLLYPSPLNIKIYNLTSWEKFNVVYTHFLYEYANYLNEADEISMLSQTLGYAVPPMSELYNNVDMLFLNVHPIWNDNQPVPPGVVYMGGIHQLPEKELPKDLKKFLDSSKHGVIYVSFGTNVLSGMIPSSLIRIMIKVLSKLPYDILWKWDKDELPEKSQNIKISKWFPQSDLLRHQNIKLFITQGGLQSTDEALTAGVPFVCIPMLGDQWYNADKYVRHGLGKKLDIHTLNEEAVKDAIETVINDTSYRKNVVKLRNYMRDQPESPLQRTIWWIEYIIRHGGAKQLRAPAANITYYEYFVMDLLLLVLLMLLMLLIFVVVTIVFVHNLVFGRKMIKKSKKNN